MMALLRLTAFRRLVFGRVISMFGNSVAPIALAFAVLDLTGSVRDLGLVVGARSVFNVLFVLLGGVLADRLPRQFVLVATSLLAGLSQAAAAGLLLTHHATVPILMALEAFNGTVAAISQPASAAVISQTIPDEQRRQANAVSRLGLNLAQIIGTAAGGLLVVAIGSAWGLAIDGATFLLGAYFFALVRVPRVERQPRAHQPGIVADLRTGWSEFIARTWVWVVVLAFTFFNMGLVAAQGVLGPALADATFGRRDWGFILAATVIGSVLGAVIAMRLRTRRLLLLGVIGCLGEVVMVGALGLWPNVYVLVPLFFLGGIGLEQFNVAWEVSVQEHVPADLLARVYSYDMLGSFLAIPAGQVLAGPLAIAVGIRPAMIICAGVVGLATVGMLASRSVRRLEHRPAAPVQANPVVVAT
jgi:MFS family permease